MIPINLKPNNYRQIVDHVQKRSNDLQGSKMHALYKLIEKKGETIQTEFNKLAGVKALQISPAEFIAIKRVGGAKNFYPCCLQTYLLTSIN